MILRMVRRSIPILLLSLAVLGCGREPVPPHSPGELTIAAASSLRPVVDALVDEWNDRAPDVPARASYGASGALFAQINASAPFDLMLSADDVYPRRLRDQDVADDPFQYAMGRLVIWTPDDLDPIEKLSDLSDPRFEKIAVASPNLAPYGEAALEALDGAGIYDDIKGRLLFAGNVSEAAHFAESGGADAAILPASLFIGTDLSRKGHRIDIPAELHEEITHEGTIITASPDREAATAFVAMLLSEEGRAILTRYGFETVPNAPPADNGE